MNSLPTLAGALVLALVVAALCLALFSAWTARKVEQVLPARGRMIEVPGATLHVHEQGSGPAILLIHGLAGQMAHYTYGVIEQLARDYRVVAVDRPGSGHSTRGTATAADLSTQAAALSALIDKLQLGRPLVVGHSLGGAVALALAVEHPDRVGALALIAPVTHAPDDAPAPFKALTIETPWLRKLFAWTLAVPGSIATSAKVLGQVFGPEAAPGDFPTRGGGLLSLRPGAFLAACDDLQAVPASLPVIAERYGELRMPVRVLYGRGDRILDWQANGQALVDKVPGATLQLVDGGHMLPVTQPELTAGFIGAAARELASAPEDALRGLTG